MSSSSPQKSAEIVTAADAAICDTIGSCLPRKAFNRLKPGYDPVRSGQPRRATANPQAIDANDDTC
jgi:hypothetical protein